ncbi:MAG TPA: ABC transporter ATP-binding protein [Rhodoblastus sp.]|nr:ABC transporter ATP-binding protein [Rhodoblastus sp.]
MQPTPILQFEHVSKRFGATVAVEGVSVAVAPGEFFALLGPSGCGKTTLMRMAAGFERPDEGRVLIAGADATAVPPHKRPVNMMFQSYALFPHMSVADNIAFGLKAAGFARDAVAARVAEMVRLAQLQGLEKRKPHQLSGGQKQRTALARALARGTKLLLLDEPLGALDRKLREETQFELMDIQKRLGAAFVVVTHDQDEAMSMANRIAVMRAGKIEQIGSPADIYERPRSRYVAEFIGEINIFEGRASRAGDALRLETPEGLIEAPMPCALTEGATVAVAVRPERMRLASAGERGANRLAGVVHDFAYRGDRRVFRVRLNSGALARVAASSAQSAPQPGEAVTVAFDAADCVALDA